MAVVRVSGQDLTPSDAREIAEYLKTCNIDYERWQAGFPVAADATAEEKSLRRTGDRREIHALSVNCGFPFV